MAPRALVAGVVTGGFVPLGELALRAMTGSLGADPVAFVLNRLGLVALVLLVAGLACTPLQRFAGLRALVHLRRPLGLLAFGYAALHAGFYLAVDQGLDLAAVVEDVVKRPFVTVGVLALGLLAPLAWTSRDASLREMGPKRWKRLHRLVYPAVILALVHFLLRAKADLGEPLAYGAVAVALLLARAVPRAPRTSTPPT